MFQIQIICQNVYHSDFMKASLHESPSYHILWRPTNILKTLTFVTKFSSFYVTEYNDNLMSIEILLSFFPYLRTKYRIIKVKLLNDPDHPIKLSFVNNIISYTPFLHHIKCIWIGDELRNWKLKNLNVFTIDFTFTILSYNRKAWNS